MKFTTDGLIVKESFTGESDRIITVLTRDRGLLRSFAPGARSIKSRNVSSTQLLAYSRLSFAESKGIYRVESAAAHDVFFGLRSDIEKLALAQYFCELSSAFVQEGDTSEEILRLMLNCIKFLETGAKPAKMLKAIAELRLISLSGYMPDLVACSVCGCFGESVYHFNISEGTVTCTECLDGLSTGIPIPYSVFCAMRHIIYSDFNKLFSFSLDDESLSVLTDVCERYLLERADKRFASLEFYNSLT